MSDENLVLGLFVMLPCLFGGLLCHLYRSLRRRTFAPGWSRVILGNFLLLGFLLSLGLLAGEAFFRFIYDTTDALACTKVSQRWLERYWHMNPAGVRDDINYGLKRPPGLRRITFVGDSFTAGHGVKRVGDRFVNLLRQRHPEWEAHSFAELGMDTGDEIRYLRECLTKGYELDDVVLVYCLNDVADLVPNRSVQREDTPAIGGLTGWLVRSSYFANLVCYRYRAMRNPEIRNYFQFVRETADGPVWGQQQARLREFKALVESHHGRLLVVTFPFLHRLGAKYEFQAVHEALDTFWHSEHVPHLDLFGVYRDLSPGKVTVNSFDAHPNEFAHALAAAAIEKFLAEHARASLSNASTRPWQ